jgi:hypothetical protein
VVRQQSLVGNSFRQAVNVPLAGKRPVSLWRDRWIPACGREGRRASQRGDSLGIALKDTERRDSDEREKNVDAV